MNLDNNKNMVKRAIKNEHKEVKAQPLVKSRNKKRILTKNQKSRMEKEKFEKAMVDMAMDRVIGKIEEGTVTADNIKTHNLKGENQ